MNRVIHFEFGAVEPERCVEFYRSVFGWKIHKWEGPPDYWLVDTGEASEPGINGGIMRHKDAQPRTVNTVGVESLEKACAAVEKFGGKVVMPKMAIQGIGWQAYCTDSEGNIFGIHQLDPSAK